MEEEDHDAWERNSCTFHNEDACSAVCQMMQSNFRWPFQYYGTFSTWTVTRIVGSILASTVTVAIALAGAIMGAIIGAIAGRSAQCGFLRGVGLGAVAGVVLSFEVIQASRAYWQSECSGAIPSLGDFVDDLMTGRFVHDFVVPAVSATQRWQLTVPEMNTEELYEMLPRDDKVEGASVGMLQSLPKHIVTQTNESDTYGLSCAICLQELEHGDLARTLPTCKHTYHLKCVDQWFAKQFICPVCRHCVQCPKVMVACQWE